MAADTEPPPKKVKFSPKVQVQELYKCAATDAFTWHLIDASKLAQQLASGGHMFKCEYYNQPFGEHEEITGYRGLKVDVWVDGATFCTWVDVQFEDERPKATDIHKALAEWFPAGYSRTRSAFEAAVAAAAKDAGGKLPWGELGRGVGERRLEVEGTPRLELRHVKLAEAPAWFKALHKRLEPLLIFTVDGASFIDPEDERWELVAAVMDDGARQTMVGFMTVYNFYAWPLTSRPRVAQVLVLPPYQGAGIGKALLKAAYDLAVERDASDLVFEDPSPELQRTREKLEVEMLLGQDWISSALQAAIAAAAAGPSPPAAGPSPLALPADLAARITKELKIHHHHLGSCWEAALHAHPAAREAGTQGLIALQDLVRRRIKEAHAQTVDENTEGKKIVEVPSEHAKDDPDFFMWRPRGGKRGGEAAAAGGGEVAGDSGASGSGAQAADGLVSVGRHNITQMDADEWEEKLLGLLVERMGQLEELRRRLAGEPSSEEEEDDEDEGEEGSMQEDE